MKVTKSDTFKFPKSDPLQNCSPRPPPKPQEGLGFREWAFRFQAILGCSAEKGRKGKVLGHSGFSNLRQRISCALVSYKLKHAECSGS